MSSETESVEKQGLYLFAFNDLNKLISNFC